MAERTVNVTINYKVNTADVVKAQAASRAAQKATDDLRKSSSDYGKAAAQAHKQNSDAARKAQADTASLSKEFSNLYTSVRLFLTAGLAKELLDASLNMAKLSGNIEGVSKAFNRIPNATLLLRDLQKATHGTVTDLELMQRALTAQNFRIPLEKLGTLLEFAAVKAQQTGQEVNHLINYIVSGIGYRSIKRLDDLGFTANRVKEALGGVSLQAASMGEVMDAVSKLMQEDLEKTGGFAQTAKTEVELLEKAWHDLGVEVSKQGTSTGFIGLLREATETLRVFFKAGGDFKQIPAVLALEEINRLAVEQAAKFRDANQQLEKGQRLIDTDKRLFQLSESLKILDDLMESDKERVKVLESEIAVLFERNKSMIGLQKQGTEEAKLINQKEDEIDAIESSTEARTKNKAVLAGTIQILVDYRDTIKESARSEEELIGIIEKKREEIEALQDQIEKTTNVGDLGASGRLIKELEARQKELDALLGKKDKDDEKRENDAAKRQRENDRRSFEHWKYYDDLKRKKNQETEEERTRIAEDEAKKRLRIEEEEAKQKAQLQQTILQLSEDLLSRTVELATTSRDNEVERLRDYYNEQIELAGDNERAKKELRIKQEREVEAAQQREKEREKKAASTRILIDGLVAIAKIFRDFGWPAGIAPAAIMTGITAVNVAQVRKYAKGKVNIDGPGSETSDSIPAMLSKGESVINAKATRRSMGLLEAIQANKIDDRILKSIDFSGGRTVHASIDDARIVKELKAIRNSQFDLERQGRQLYRVYTDGEGNKKRVRSKNIT